MSDWLEVLKLGMTLSFLTGIALLVVFAMPKSPLRDALLPYAKVGFAILCGIYVLSPVDMAPEAVLGPVGLLDDFGAVVLGIKAVKSAMTKPPEALDKAA